MSILQYFKYEHLPAHLQEFSKKFHDLVHELDGALPDCAEKTVMFRKLLEAKDCAVRAALPVEKNEPIRKIAIIDDIVIIPIYRTRQDTKKEIKIRLHQYQQLLDRKELTLPMYGNSSEYFVKDSQETKTTMVMKKYMLLYYNNVPIGVEESYLK